MSQRKTAPKTEPAKPAASKTAEAPEPKEEQKTITLAHNIRTPSDHFLAGQTYPVGTGEGEIHPSWLDADPKLDAAHPGNLAARSKREALQEKIRARSFEDHKTRQRLLADVGQGPTRRRRRVGLV